MPNDHLLIRLIFVYDCDSTQCISIIRRLVVVYLTRQLYMHNQGKGVSPPKRHLPNHMHMLLSRLSFAPGFVLKRIASRDWIRRADIAGQAL